MTAPEVLAAPFPWFGGKRRAASTIWEALGDPGGYVEPFAGSAAVLLGRPPFAGRRVETLNDLDGWLVNAWRAIKLHPAETAKHAAGPVTEIDYHARLAWLQERRTPDLVAGLEGDPEVCDPKAAGWWLYVLACGIGAPFDPGPWRVVDGLLADTRKLPHLSDAGKGVNRRLPHLGDAGKGVNKNLEDREGPSHEARIGAYLQTLAARLERVRITCGDWRRVLRPSALRATASNSAIGILLDPPYATSGDLYADGDADGAISSAVRAWCLTANPQLRIALCGYDTEHADLEAHGWRVIQGSSGSGPGYSARADNGRRERIWLSPACLYGGQDTLLEAL